MLSGKITDTTDMSDISPHLRIRVSPRARRLALRLDSRERVVNLVVPKRTSVTRARDFAASHAQWIEKRIESLPPPVPYEDGAIIPVGGVDRRITILYDPALRKTDILLTDNEINVSTNQAKPSQRIERFLKRQAEKTVVPMAHEKAGRLGAAIRAVSFRDPKSRWGSCSNDGRLSFSWRLVFAPLPAIDYIVSHEVAHLKHMDHSKAFWSTCRSLCGDYLEGQVWIRSHGHELMRYGQQYTPEHPEG